MKRKPKRREKHPDVVGHARECVASGRYRDTRHATERKDERSISRLEIRQVIEGGFHERRKDEFKIEWQAWNYSIRGKTIDGRDLRIVISFDEDDSVLVITAIDIVTGG